MVNKTVDKTVDKDALRKGQELFLENLIESLVVTSLVSRAENKSNVVRSKSSGNICMLEVSGVLEDEQLEIYKYIPETKSFHLERTIKVLDKDFTPLFMRSMKAIIGLS